MLFQFLCEKNKSIYNYQLAVFTIEKILELDESENFFNEKDLKIILREYGIVICLENEFYSSFTNQTLFKHIEKVMKMISN